MRLKICKQLCKELTTIYLVSLLEIISAYKISHKISHTKFWTWLKRYTTNVYTITCVYTAGFYHIKMCICQSFAHYTFANILADYLGVYCRYLCFHWRESVNKVRKNPVSHSTDICGRGDLLKLLWRGVVCKMGKILYTSHKRYRATHSSVAYSIRDYVNVSYNSLCF